MPTWPTVSPHARAIRASTFEAFAKKLGAKRSEPGFVPLHLGDTYLLPPSASRELSLDDPTLHLYAPVPGIPALREAGAADLGGFGLTVEASDVFVTAGATGGLDLALNASLMPGDEVLVLTPTWPLIVGLLQRRGAVPVEVDVAPSGWLPEDPAVLRSALATACTERTCGIALCNPNNPSGFVYGDAHLSAIAELAAERDLWIYYDAVYMDLAWGGASPILEFVQRNRERTFCVTSFSKSFGLAGHRVGLLVGPPGAASGRLQPLLSHSTYHTGTMGQRMAIAALGADPAGERARRLAVAQNGTAEVVRVLGDLVDLHTPQGGAFVLLDLRERVPDDAAALAFLDRCLERLVSLAPGSAFGQRFGRFARLCVTATPPDVLAEGLARVRDVLTTC